MKRYFITLESLLVPVLNRVMLFAENLDKAKKEAQNLLNSNLKEEKNLRFAMVDTVKIEDEKETVAIGDVTFDYTICW